VLIVVFIVLKACGGNEESKPAARPSSQSFLSPTLPSASSETKSNRAVAALPQEIRYIGPDSLNTRSAPNGRVVGKMKKYAEVTIFSRDGAWIRISEASKPALWISEDHTCSTSSCSDSLKWKAPSAPVSRPTVARVNTYEPSNYTSSCSCASSSNCIGPRGGRYCITSGGNKRYR